MKNLYIALATFLFINTLQAQNQAANWYFGHNSGITFSTNPPTALSGGMINTDEGCTALSDASGNLLFYSDGITVWDRTHAVMPNGTGLLGDPSSTQSGVVIPLPGSSSLFYLFTAPVNAGTNPVAYSIVDMTQHNGFGDVIVKNDTLLTNAAEKLTAVFHNNGTDAWILVHDFPNNNFYAYLLTAAGLNTVPVISAAGNAITNTNNKIGYLKASPCGNRLAMANWASGGQASTLELFDFDNSTGIVSNGALLGTWNLSSGVYGCEFSPDNTRLYASIITPGLTLQYNLAAGSTAAIIASMDTAGTSPTNFNGALQTGPDGRIYLTKYNDLTLAAIMNPNQPVATCGYIENYVSLIGTGSLGLPDFFSSFFCEIPSGINSPSPAQVVSVYPNPISSSFTISVQQQNTKTLSITIYDMIGQNVYSHHESNFTGTFSQTVDWSSFNKGIYLLDVMLDCERITKKMVKE